MHGHRNLKITFMTMSGVSCRGPTFHQVASLHEVSSASHYSNLVNVIRIASSFPLLTVRSLTKQHLSNYAWPPANLHKQCAGRMRPFKYYLTKQTSLQHVTTSVHQYMCIKSKFGPAVSSRKVPKKLRAPYTDEHFEAEPVRTAYKPTRWVHIKNVYYTGCLDCHRTARRRADEIVAVGRPTALSVPQDSVLLSPPLDTPSVAFRCI